MSIRTLIRNLTVSLQTIIRLRQHDSLETASSYILEQQNVNYTHNTFIPPVQNFSIPRITITKQIMFTIHICPIANGTIQTNFSTIFSTKF